VNWAASVVSTAVNWVSMRAAHVVTSMTRDFAEHSPLLSHFLPKLVVVRPPIEMPTVSDERVARLRRQWGVAAQDVVVGMAARLATEKGAEVLARAMPQILARWPTARVLYVGEHDNVFGEEAYARRMVPIIAGLGGHWKFLGVLPPEDMSAFFRLCRVTVLPSLNRTESFGMVQVESMISGTPVVASDLPGVRFATADTGMGLTVPPGDSQALSQAILQVVEHPQKFRGDPAQVAARYAPARTAQQVEEIYESLLSGPGRRPR
jgi:glycosyltransferase involved in cell wall biosynthesis